MCLLFVASPSLYHRITSSDIGVLPHLTLMLPRSQPCLSEASTWNPREASFPSVCLPFVASPSLYHRITFFDIGILPRITLMLPRSQPCLSEAFVSLLVFFSDTIRVFLSQVHPPQTPFVSLHPPQLGTSSSDIVSIYIRNMHYAFNGSPGNNWPAFSNIEINFKNGTLPHT